MFLLLQPASAQLPAPQLDGIFPAGAAAGTTTEVAVTGTNLENADHLIFSDTRITSETVVKPPTEFDEGPQTVENTFRVTVSPDVPPGRYSVRCQGKYGLSNPCTFVVGEGPDVREAEPNQAAPEATSCEVPATIHGQTSGNADVDWFRIEAKPGQSLCVRVLAGDLGSPLHPVVTVVDADGTILAQSEPWSATDPTLNITAGADGIVLLKIHDAHYRQGPQYVYSIDIRPQPSVEFVDPPCVVPGQPNQLTVFGFDLPQGKPSDVTLDGRQLQQRQVTITPDAGAAGTLQYSGIIEPHVAVMDGMEFRLPESRPSARPILLTFSTQAPQPEQADNDKPESAQKLTLPAEIVGRFYPQRDTDWFSFDAARGQRISIQVYSNRLGINTDPSLLIQQVTTADNGTQQVKDVMFLDDVSVQNRNNESGRFEFETSSTDPFVVFEAPEDASYRLLLRDGAGSVRNDPRLAYRLVLREPQPDFRIVAVPENSFAGFCVRRGGRAFVRVFAERIDGFDGEIHVRVENLPPGVTCDEIVIGPSNRMGTLVLTATDDAAPATGLLKITARAHINGADVQRTARYGSASTAWRQNQPNARMANVPARLVDRLQFCITEIEPAPARLTIGDGKPIQAVRGLSVKIPYSVHRRDGVSGSLVGFPMDYPDQTTAQQVSIGTNTKGEFELRFNVNSVPGTYSIWLAGYLQNMPYRHNPEAVIAAKSRQERINQIVADANKSLQQATQAASARQTELNRANSALNSAKSASATAAQALANAKTQLRAAEAALKEKQRKSASSPEDETAKQQLTTAEAAVASAKQATEKAQQQADQAAKRLKQSQEEQRAAEEAKKTADKQVVEARDFVKRAQAEKQKTDQLVRAREQQARQRNINVYVPSNTLTLQLAEYPIEIEAPAAVTIEQGQKQDVRIQLTRLYDYKGNVSVQVLKPSGANGINVANVSINGSQTEGTLKFSLASNATPGTHELKLRLSLSGLSGGTMTIERPLSLTIKERAMNQ